MALTITDQNFMSTMEENEIVVIDFWAEWCGPCRMVGPIIEQIAEEYSDRAVVGKLNVDHNPIAAAQYGVRSIPTVIYLKNGEVVDKQVGAVTKSRYLAKLDALLA